MHIFRKLAMHERKASGFSNAFLLSLKMAKAAEEEEACRTRRKYYRVCVN